MAKAKIVTLLNMTNPAFSIYDPGDGSWAKFEGGRLDIADDDPHYAIVMAEASRNPAISIHTESYTCVWCGEVAADKTELLEHVKDIHFDKWLADEDAEYAEKRADVIKSRAGVFCDVCVPAQEFPDEAALAAHVKLVHADKPADAPEGGGGDIEDVKAAAAKGTKTKAAAGG